MLKILSFRCFVQPSCYNWFCDVLGSALCCFLLSVFIELLSKVEYQGQTEAWQATTPESLPPRQRK